MEVFSPRYTPPCIIAFRQGYYAKRKLSALWTGGIKIILGGGGEVGCIGSIYRACLNNFFFSFFFFPCRYRRVSFVKLFRVCLNFLSRRFVNVSPRAVFRDVNFCAVETKYSFLGIRVYFIIFLWQNQFWKFRRINARERGNVRCLFFDIYVYIYLCKSVRWKKLVFSCCKQFNFTRWSKTRRKISRILTSYMRD